MNEFEEKLDKRLTDALREAKNLEGARNTLALLFPKAERILKTYVPSDVGDVKASKLKRRLAQRDFAANYFTLSPASTSWGRTEFENLLKDGPTATFDYLNKRAESLPIAERSILRRVFLDLLDSVFGSQLKLSQEWLDAVLKESVELLGDRNSSRSFLGTDNEDRLRWLIVNALVQLSESERAAMLKSAINSAVDITVLSDVVRSITGDVNPEGAKGKRETASLGQEEESVRTQMVERVRDLARTNELWHQAIPGRLLWFWWGAGAAPEVMAFTDRTMDTEDGLNGLLDETVSTVISSSGNYERVGQEWSKIVNLSALAERAQQLLNKPTSDEQKQLARRFLDGLQREREHPY